MIFRWIRAYKSSTKETKMFIFQWAIYFFLLIASTIYCYARLDFHRTAPPKQTHTHLTP